MATTLRYYKILSAGILCLLTCIVTQVLAADDNICFDCEAQDGGEDCKTFHHCQAGEKCFQELLELTNGTLKYSWGCASSVLCTLDSTRRSKRVSLQACFKCCDGNFCNFGSCQNDYCSQIQCKNGATCTNTPLAAVCNCPIGYTGERCETDIDECASSPCQYNGTCSDNIGNYRCTCPAGITGDNCEINIDECSKMNLCRNGATCIDGINRFTCACQPGYTGLICSTEIDECLSDPCQNGATCTDAVNGYTCTCAVGFTGTNCETNIDDCFGVTCQNDGVCQDLIGGYQCLCTLGFTGSLCETSLGRVCYQCSNVVGDPTNCTNEVICGSGEECYMEHEIIPEGFMFNLGCVSTKLCSMYEMVHTDGKRDSVPLQLCYECCDSNDCNHHSCEKTRISTTSSTTSKTTTTMASSATMTTTTASMTTTTASYTTTITANVS